MMTNAFFERSRRGAIEPFEIADAVIMTCSAFGKSVSAAFSGWHPGRGSRSMIAAFGNRLARPGN